MSTGINHGGSSSIASNAMNTLAVFEDERGKFTHSVTKDGVSKTYFEDTSGVLNYDVSDVKGKIPSYSHAKSQVYDFSDEEVVWADDSTLFTYNKTSHKFFKIEYSLDVAGQFLERSKVEADNSYNVTLNSDYRVLVPYNYDTLLIQSGNSMLFIHDNKVRERVIEVSDDEKIIAYSAYHAHSTFSQFTDKNANAIVATKNNAGELKLYSLINNVLSEVLHKSSTLIPVNQQFSDLHIDSKIINIKVGFDFLLTPINLSIETDNSVYHYRVMQNEISLERFYSLNDFQKDSNMHGSFFVNQSDISAYRIIKSDSFITQDGDGKLSIPAWGYKKIDETIISEVVYLKRYGSIKGLFSKSEYFILSENITYTTDNHKSIKLFDSKAKLTSIQPPVLVELSQGGTNKEVITSSLLNITDNTNATIHLSNGKIEFSKANNEIIAKVVNEMEEAITSCKMSFNNHVKKIS